MARAVQLRSCGILHDVRTHEAGLGEGANRTIETILHTLFHFDGYLFAISLKKPSSSPKHLRMLFVGVGQVTDDQWFCYSAETLSQKKLGKWPNIFQSLQPVQVIQDLLR